MGDKLHSLAELDRELVDRKGLKGMVRAAWKQVEPASKFLDNWHIDEICLHLEALYTGDIRNLIINIPPGCMKSLLSSVMFPLWVWTIQPDFRFLFASFDGQLAKRDARKMRDTIMSDWWKARWPEVQIKPDRDSAEEFENTATGYRLSTTPRGKGTGRHVDLVVVDDPHKPMDLARGPADDSAESSQVWEWWTGTIPTRTRDPKTFRKLVIMQRLAENDLVGRIQTESEEKFEVLRLPMRYESHRPCVTVLGPGVQGGDRRTDDGELLWPERFPLESVERIESGLRAIGGERNVAGQMQQQPAADTGNRFKADWIQHWGVPGSRYEILPHISEMVLELSCDATFKGAEAKKKPDFVVIQLWAFHKSNALLLDQVRGQWSFVESLDAFKKMCAKWPRAWVKKIEDKANGPAIANVLSSEIPGVQLVTPEGGKEARASAVEPVWRAKAVWLPPKDTVNDDGEKWVPGFISELLAFPAGRHDDQVDAMTQGLLEFASGATAALLVDFAKAAQGVRWTT